jgi:hypothetical protein
MQADLDAGLRATTMLAAEFIRSRDGLWTIVEGGWDWVQVSTVPFHQPVPLFIELETGTIEPPGTNLELTLIVLRPMVSRRGEKAKSLQLKTLRSGVHASLELWSLLVLRAEFGKRKSEQVRWCLAPFQLRCAFPKRSLTPLRKPLRSQPLAAA